MRQLSLFDPGAACGCDPAGPRCCADAARATLAVRAPQVLEAAAADGLDPDRLARMVLAHRHQRRDPLGVPDGWRLYTGQLACDPAMQRQLDAGPVPLHACTPAWSAPAPTRLAGLLLAADAALDGADVPSGPASRLAVAAWSPDAVAAGPVTAMAPWLSTVPASHHVEVDGRPLPLWPTAGTCPTATSPVVGVLAAVALLVTADGRLVADEHGPAVATAEVTAAADTLQATFAAAVRAAADGPITHVRAVTAGRDLARAGRPVVAGLAVVDTVPDGCHVVPLPSDAGSHLQSLAAATAPLGRARRTALDVVGAAIRERRISL